MLGRSGLPNLFAVNTLAPFILSSLMDKPERLVFVTSEMHYSGQPNLESEAKLQASRYGDSKLHDVMLAKAFARRWPDVPSNSVDPGWVPTKMGGKSAPQSLDDAVDAFTMLALGSGVASGKTGVYFEQSEERACSKAATAEKEQDRLLEMLEKISGVPFPN